MVKTLVLRALFVVSLAGFAAELGAVCTSGSRSLRVPEDCGSIAEAVSALASGGTIDIATGTYSFSASGLDLGKKNKAMTLQARALGQVTFTGNNASPIVRIDNGTSASQPIVFEGIRFVNGYSASANRAGGVTLLNAEASFVDCTFSNNRMMESTTGGGALGLYGGSRAVVVRSAFTTNTAKNNGGAIYAVRNSGQNPTSVWVHASTFSGNSTASSGFTASASGGAIYVRDAELFVADSTFEDNAAGWVGGAIYAWGDFATSSPYCNYTAPATDILITGSRFDDNRADDAASPSQVPQTQGGAIHTENCVRVRVYRSLFERNWADWGGAISVDHSNTIVEQTAFRNNYATVPDISNSYPTGGTFVSLNGDSSGTDHPTPELVFRRVLVQGGRAGQPGAATAQLGGCFNVRGDTSKAIPVPSSARVKTTIADSAFFDCGVALQVPELALIRGGAIDTNRADLRVSNTLFARSRADGGSSAIGRGSGIALRDDSVASFSGSVVFAGGYADVPTSSPGDVDLYETASTHSGSLEEWAEQPPATAGILVAAPSLPASAGGPLAGEAFLTWAYAGSSATLDGNSVGSNPKNGVAEKSEGGHQLVVSGLASCGRCSATIVAPVLPATTLAASPVSISPGDSSSLSWTTPEGTLVTSIVDRGLGKKGASGSSTVAPGGTMTYRRLAITQEGGSLAEETIYVGEAPPPPPDGDEIFSDGFDSGLGAWDSVVN